MLAWSCRVNTRVVGVVHRVSFGTHLDRRVEAWSLSPTDPQCARETASRALGMSPDTLDYWNASRAVTVVMVLRAGLIALFS